jgi:hypothetical protein
MFINFTYKPNILISDIESSTVRLFVDLVNLLTVTDFSDSTNPISDNLYTDATNCEFVNRTNSPYNSFLSFVPDADSNISYTTSGSAPTNYKLQTYLKVSNTNKWLYLSVQSGQSTPAMNNMVYNTYTIGLAFCDSDTEVVNYATTHKFRGKEFSISSYTALERPLYISFLISMSSTHLYFNVVRHMQSFTNAGASIASDEYDRYDSGILLVNYEPIDYWAKSTNPIVANYLPWAFLDLTFGHNTLTDAAGQSLNMYRVSGNTLVDVNTQPDLCLFKWVANTSGLYTSAGVSFNSQMSSSNKEKRIHLSALNIQAISGYTNCFGKVSSPSNIFAVNGTGYGWQDELQTLNTGSLLVVHRIYPAAAIKSSTNDSKLSNIKLAIPIL